MLRPNKSVLLFMLIIVYHLLLICCFGVRAAEFNLCPFDDYNVHLARCKVQLTGGLRWRVSKASNVSDDFLPQVDANNNTEGTYAYLLFDEPQNPGARATIDMPNLGKDDGAKCLKVSYVYFGPQLATLQLIRSCGDDSLTIPVAARGDVVVWQLNGLSIQPQDWSMMWSKIEIPLYYNDDTPLDSCKLSFVATAASHFRGGIALDNIMASSCAWESKPNICTFQEKLCKHWFADSSWSVKGPNELTKVPYDHTYQSTEGKFLAMTTRDHGCSSAKLTGIRLGLLPAPTACLSFVANAFNEESVDDQIADFYLHITDENGKIVTTPWTTRLHGVKVISGTFTWSSIYAFVDVNWAVGPLEGDVPNYRFVLEARYCSEKGRGGIVIDSLSSLDYSISQCRNPGDDDFQLPTSFWESADVDVYHANWLMLTPTKYGTQILADHTFPEDSINGQFMIADTENFGWVALLQSGTPMTPTHARCVTFYVNYNSESSSLKALIRRMDTDAESERMVWHNAPPSSSALNAWQLSSFSYFSPYFHRILFQSVDQVAIDDITITDGLCACRPTDAEDCSLPLLKDVSWHPHEIESYYGRVGECDVPTLTSGLFTDVTLEECARHCDTYDTRPSCRTFVYDDNKKNCQLKALNCRALKPVLDKRTYERKEVKGYFSQPGECTSTPLKTLTPTNGAQSCADACTKDSFCAKFVYSSRENKCWLHGICATVTPTTDRLTFEMIEFNGFHMYAGSCTVSPDDSTVVKSLSRRDCSTRCDVNDTCAAFIYNALKKECTLTRNKACATQHMPVADTFTYIKMGVTKYSCDFEGYFWCSRNGWQLDPLKDPDSYDFTVVATKDGYAANGPKRDATLNIDLEGHYLLLTYVGNPSIGLLGNVATPVLDPQTASCLSFSYYLFGPSVGELQVLLLTSDNKTSIIWEADSSQTDIWLEAQFNLRDLSKTSYRLLFQSAQIGQYFGSVAIDDVYIAPHNCFPQKEISCNFEGSDSCSIIDIDGFSQTSARSSLNDHTYNSAYGHYAWVPTVDPKKPAVLSIAHEAKYDQCVTFWYHRGSTCVSLRAGFATSNFRRLELVTSPIAPEDWFNFWTEARIHLPGGYDSDDSAKIIFIAETNDCGSKNNTWLAIDDIVINEQGCSRKGSCNFDSQDSHCLFEEIDMTTFVMPFLWGHPFGLSRIPAPPQDNSLMNPVMGGFALVDQVSRTRIPEKAALVSPWLTTLNDWVTVTFYYSLAGPESGALEVQLILQSVPENTTTKWQIFTTSNDWSWKFARFSFHVDKPDVYRLVFGGYRGTNSYAIMAIDDVVIMPGIRGSLYPTSAEPKYPITPPSPLATTTAITPYPTFPPSELIFTCNFEESDCDFASHIALGFKRVCHLSGVCAAPLGPYLDHTTGDYNGQYMYLSLLHTGFSNRVEMIRNYDSKTPSCLSYWYIATGSNVDYITSGFKSSSGTSNVYKRKGAQSDQWAYVEHYLPAASSEKDDRLIFATQRSRENSGDIAIDDIQLWPHECPPRDNECTFDAGYPSDNLCNVALTKDPATDATWAFTARGKGSQEDHTYQTTFGRYAFVDSKWSKSFDGVSMTIPFEAPPNPGKYCLQFWYRMNGRGRVKVLSNNNLIVTVDPFSGSAWAESLTDIVFPPGGFPDGKWSPVFVASYEYPGYIFRQETIHIDDIKLLKHSCTTERNCTFETDQCGWQNDDPGQVQFSWMYGSGYYNGPIPHDHTLDSSEGHYMFLPISPPLARGSRARLVGPETFTGINCVSFYYYIKASYESKYQTALRVLAVTDEKELSYWLVDSGTFGKWAPAVLPIDGLDKPYEIVFESFFDADYFDVVIGIDDVEITNKTCERIPAGDESDPSVTTASWLTCPFDNEYCQFIPDTTNMQDKAWAIAQDDIDSTPSATISYSILRTNFSAAMSSRWLATGSMSTVYCGQFSYAFHGLNPGSFTVVVQNQFNQPVPIFMRYGSEGYRYRKAYVQGSSPTDFQLKFMATAWYTFDPQSSGLIPDLDFPYSGTLSIRQLITTEGPCPETITPVCDFEANRCKSLQPDDQVVPSSSVWKIVSMQEDGYMGVFIDHTTLTPLGHFYLASPAQADPKIEYVLRNTNTNQPTSDQCLTFWYWLERGSLKVYAAYNNGDKGSGAMLIWSTEQTSDTELVFWRSAIAPIPAASGFEKVQYYFTAQLQSNNTHAAIDDVRLMVGTCPHPLTCDFEYDTCGYDQYLVSDSFIRPEIGWQWVSASHTESVEDAPLVDVTAKTEFGHYLFIDGNLLKNSTSGQTMVRARSRESGTAANTDDSCITLWYQIGGDDGAMTLKVSILVEQKEWSVVSFSRNTNGLWNSTKIQTPKEKNTIFKVQLDGIRQGVANEKDAGFIAIDEIAFNTQCSEPTDTTTAAMTTQPIDPTEFAFANCDFDDDFCKWTNDQMMMPFQRTSSYVFTSVGPTGDVNGAGYYAYIKADEKMPQNGTARLISGNAVFPELTTVCVRFYYHMTGSGVDTLQLIDAVKQTENVVWQRFQAQGNSWKFGHVQLDLTSNHQLIFEASVFGKAKAVIAIDQVSLAAGPCRHLQTCDFEDPLLCGWHNDPMANSIWRRVNGNSHPRYGPFRDHTYGTGVGYFLHFDSDSQDKTINAILSSPEYKLGEDEGCLHIWFESERVAPTFFVYIVPTNNGLDLDDQRRAVFQVSDFAFQGGYRRISARLREIGSFRIKIEGTAMTIGGVSIDDVEVDLHHTCGHTAFCDFETGECGWQNAFVNAGYWRVQKGPSETPGTGPNVDHTLGTEDGSYLYLASKRFSSFVGTYESEIISPYQFKEDRACFRFWYHMWGPGMGTLVVSTYITEKLLWNMTGNQGNQWKQGLADVDLTSGLPLVLQIKHIPSMRAMGEPAIDDVALLPGECSQYEVPVDPDNFFVCNVTDPYGRAIKIPGTQRCDLVPDCPVYGDDELDCGRSCTFDDSDEACAWEVLQKSQIWKLGTGADGNKLGPPVDATAKSPNGGYYYIDSNQSPSAKYGEAVMRLHMHPTPTGCTLRFAYILPAPPNYGDLRVSIQIGDDFFDIFSISKGKSDPNKLYDWNFPLPLSTQGVVLNRLHSEFELLISGRKDQVRNGILAIDGVELINCVFPMTSTITCDSASQFTCQRTGACVPLNKTCDLTDDCGDGSDEADCGSSPVYCNFEKGPCDLSVTSGEWKRANNPMGSKTMPPRDFSLGINYGYFFVAMKVNSTNKFRVPKNYYITKEDACELRLAISSPETDFISNTPLYLELTLQRDYSTMRIHIGEFPIEGDGEWQTARVDITSKIDQILSNSAFTIDVVATNFVNYLALDNIVLTPGCKLVSADACLAPLFYRCLSPSGNRDDMPCIPMDRFGDFIKDCPLGDDEFGFGPCSFDPPIGTTNLTLCGWEMSSDEIFELAQLPQAGRFIPNTDGPPSFNANGWLLLARTKTLRISDQFILTTPFLPKMSTRCSLRFDFYMYGTEPTERVEIQLLRPSDMTKPIDSQQFSPDVNWQTSKWFQVGGSLADNDKTKLFLQFKTNVDQLVAALALDNIEFSEDCSYTRGLPEFDCDFNDGTACQWTVQKNPEEGIAWTVGDGSQASKQGGPGADYDNPGKGKFVFISDQTVPPFLPDSIAFGTAILRSPSYPPPKDKYCLRFAYNMFGTSPGTLYVTFNMGLPYPWISEDLFTRRVSQGNQWRLAQITVDPSLAYPAGDETYYLTIDGYASRRNSGFIAIDSIKVTRGACPVGTECSFEDGRCDWTSTATEPYDFAWQRTSRYFILGHQPNTGAQVDRTTETDRGYFMQIEALGRKTGERALLKSPTYPIPLGVNAASCFHFWYHMFGKDVSTLSVTVMPTRKKRLGFSRSGNHGNHWWKGNVEIRPDDFAAADREGIFTLNIVAAVGDSDLGDIAIDDVSVRDGPCPAVATCDFERDQCGFSNVYELSDAAWLRNSGDTPNEYTGPSTDHTFGNSSGHYMFVDSSYAASQIGNLSYFASDIIQGSSDGHCLKFYYQMQGTNVGTLSVQILFPNSGKWQMESIWTKSGNQISSVWREQKITIVTEREYSIVFVADITKAASAGGGRGDIAIDDISLDQTSTCSGVPNPGNPSPKQFWPCGFETSDCGWYPNSAPEDTMLLWQRASGASPVTEDAPMYDNTRKDQNGHYFVNYGNSTNPSDYYSQTFYSRADSSYYVTNQRHCIFSFFYYFGDKAGQSSGQEVSLWLIPFGGFEIELWSQSNIRPTEHQWKPVKIDLGQQTAKFRLFFRTNARYLYNTVPGAIAFDDISFLDCASPPVSDDGCNVKDEFQCANLGCISKYLLCDGYDNCGDGSDEEACQSRIIVSFENRYEDEKYLENVPRSIDNPDVDIAWTLGTGQVDRQGKTGPNFDHTYANSSGHYYYTPTIHPGKPFSKSWLLSAPFVAPTQTCALRFYYHMYGKDIGSLTVLYRTMQNGPTIQLWRREAEVGSLWLRATVNLTSIKQDFQVVIQGMTGAQQLGNMAVDDVSFSEGCQLRKDPLPIFTTTTIPTTVPPPCEKDPSKFGCFASGKGVCIEKQLVCNFDKDCPNGEDESAVVCVANPTTFNGSSLEQSGWFAQAQTKYTWKLVNASDIPITCRGACPTTDADGGLTYVAADSFQAQYSHERTFLTMKSPISRTGPQCVLSFWYIVTTNGVNSDGSLILYKTDPKGSSETPNRQRLWSTESSRNMARWQNIEILLGINREPFYLEFEAVPAVQGYTATLPAAAALDAIEFLDCAELEQSPTCPPDQFRCSKGGGCVERRYLCDFADHCGDGIPGLPGSSSDEAGPVCSAYVARCAYDAQAASCLDWTNGEGSFLWKVAEPRDSQTRDYPPSDHTLNSYSGHILLLTYDAYNYFKVARYKTAKRVILSSAPGADCRLRFWFYFHIAFRPASEIGALFVVARTSYNPITDIFLGNFTSGTGDLWLRKEIPILPQVVGENRPFELLFFGDLFFYVVGSSLAIDDISMTPDCHLTDIPLPGQEGGSTTTLAPSCTDLPGSFQCANGNGCYSIAQHCNFMVDCQDGSDEWGCSTSCDFDTNSTYWCNWANKCQSYSDIGCDPGLKSKWKWQTGGQIPEPPNDYTTNGTGGGYLISNGWSYGDRALLQSTVFQHASPNCKLHFWFWAFNSKWPWVKSSQINVYLKTARYGSQRVFWETAGNDKEWREASALLYSKSSFEIQFEVVNGEYADADIAIDGIEFINCSPDIPSATCTDQTDFLCDDGSRCIHESQICDYNSDCRDGSDEKEDMCIDLRAPGSCTFENPDWQNSCWWKQGADNDTVEWKAVQVDRIVQGPLLDHTLGSGSGHMLYVDMLADDKLFSKAVLASKQTYPANPTGNCLLRFFYYFYRGKNSLQGNGQIKIFAIGAKTGSSLLLGKISLNTILPGTSTSNWSPIIFTIFSLEPFIIQLIGETDDNALSVMALDDLSLTDGCRTGKDRPNPSQNVTKCAWDEVFCESKRFCLPSEWICDGWCDCAPVDFQQTGGVCVDEYQCEPLPTKPTTAAPLTYPSPDATTLQPDQSTTLTDFPLPTTSVVTDKPTKDGDNNLGMILGIVFGVIGAIVLGLLGTFVYYKFLRNMLPQVSLPGTEPGAGIANPIYGKSTNADEASNMSVSSNLTLDTNNQAAGNVNTAQPDLQQS